MNVTHRHKWCIHLTLFVYFANGFIYSWELQPNLVPFRQCKLTELLFSNSFLSPSAAHASSSVGRRNPQKGVMIVTADPLGDFNATSQILRYSALARHRPPHPLHYRHHPCKRPRKRPGSPALIITRARQQPAHQLPVVQHAQYSGLFPAATRRDLLQSP